MRPAYCLLFSFWGGGGVGTFAPCHYGFVHLASQAGPNVRGPDLSRPGSGGSGETVTSWRREPGGPSFAGVDAKGLRCR